MPTFNVLERTLFIKAADYGTAFALDWNDRQYLITARHLLDGTDASAQDIKIYQDGTWREHQCALVGVGSDDVDIAVLSSPLRFGKGLPLPATRGDFKLSQDVFFVGFPYKLFTEGPSFMSGRPLPFIKKGTLSAFDFRSQSKTIYLDAINNLGFSGGPIVFHNGDPSNMKVMGVVSKFRLEFEQIYDVKGDPTGESILINTGILIGYGMQPVLDIIDQNPIGLSLE